MSGSQREVLALLSKDSVDKEIAQALGISAWTVHSHVRNIFEKLHVRYLEKGVCRAILRISGIVNRGHPS